MKNIFLLLCVSSLFFSCEKDITVDLPKQDANLVVEGRIEPGLPPLVVLTMSTGYFDPTDIKTVENSFVKDAIVSVSDGTNKVMLSQYCTSSFSEQELIQISQLSGVSVESLKSINYCLYTSLDPIIFGQTGKTYTLDIDYAEEHYTASAKIPVAIPLDSLWFQVEPDRDSLGYVWATLKDPDTLGNCYRWFAQRLGKDDSFIAPNGSSFEDKFVNGTKFDFAYYRGSYQGSEAKDDNNRERGFFKAGDTVVIKFCSIEYNVYRFFRTFETETSNAGNPFGSPTTIESNVTNGALGVWAAYGAAYDTVILKK